MRFVLSLVLMTCLSAFAQSPPAGTTKVIPLTILSASTGTTAGSGFQLFPVDKTFQVCGTTTAGAGASTTKIQVSDIAAPGANDWLELGSVVLVLATTQSCDGFSTAARWKWWRAKNSAISGTNAQTTVTAGY